MTEFNNPGRPDLRDGVTRRSPAAWIGGAIIVVLILIGIGYAFNGGYGGGNNAVEHRAADVTNPAPAAAPNATPATPAATPPGANNAKP